MNRTESVLYFLVCIGVLTMAIFLGWIVGSSDPATPVKTITHYVTVTKETEESRALTECAQSAQWNGGDIKDYAPCVAGVTKAFASYAVIP